MTRGEEKKSLGKKKYSSYEMHLANIGPRNPLRIKKHRRNDYRTLEEKGVVFNGTAKAYHSLKINGKENSIKKVPWPAS